MAVNDSQQLEVGFVARPHGVRGEVRLRLHNESSDAPGHLEALRIVTVDGRQLRLEAIQQVERVVYVARVEGCQTREDAETLRDARLILPRAALSLADDEYLYQDLLGCRVVEGGQCYGTVAEVFEAGASDVLVVRDGDDERMIPFVEPWLVRVDLVAREIHVADGAAFEAVKVNR
ncbi:MAG: 16S rRNA processing protein RimM [Deltaproteobacteria bacterium]|nr:16S rRNA processing protein RimM [Deltaproteobacteria bacterium]